MGAAFTAGRSVIESMVAVARSGRGYSVLAPCGACRQLLLDYAPRAKVVIRLSNGQLRRLTVEESLPGAFHTFG
jgi:cytidine deaminase